VSEIPDWLTEMRAITGVSEKAGSGDEPKILAMRDFIAKTFPDMASYCSLYKHDATPWCGLAAAYCMARAGIRPPFGKTDTDRFLWARAWGDDPDYTVLGSPRPGCVVVMTRSGGGHVTFYESTSGSSYKCRGGNQSDAINVASYPKSSVVALVWPRAGAIELPDVPELPSELPELEEGDEGPSVAVLQKSLGLPADGEFGAVTESQVKAFQSASGLEVDGVVGPETWDHVGQLDKRVAQGSEGLTAESSAEIIALVQAAPLNDYAWKDRGRAPSGYLSGMALSFAVAVLDFRNANPMADLLARPAGGVDSDALRWYEAEFRKLGMDNSLAGVHVIRHLWTLLIGLGMRESSGRYFVGKDASAANTSAETCEAGLFQTSWNISNASPEIAKLLAAYWADPNGFLAVFQEGLTPTAGHLAVYGTGKGASYQFLAKYCPLFACMTTAVGLRLARKHWGPINRKEVELLKEADTLLTMVQEIVDAEVELPPEPPEVERSIVEINTTGAVTLVVNGQVMSEG
jgi:uncharacterized protein (TIGR02594 family)